MIFAAMFCFGRAQNATCHSMLARAPRSYEVVSEPVVHSLPLSFLDTNEILNAPELENSAQVGLSRVVLMSTGYLLLTAKVAANFANTMSSSFSSHA